MSIRGCGEVGHLRRVSRIPPRIKGWRFRRFTARVGMELGQGLKMLRAWQLVAALTFTAVSCFGQAGARQFDRPALSQSAPACGRESSVESPDHLHSAYVSCDGGEHGTHTVRVTALDSAGKEASTLSARMKLSCTPGALEWLDDHRVGVVCRTDPEVRNYLVFDIETGKHAENLGSWFQWSPDRKTLANVKLDVRFGTPAGQRSCLFLNERALYPPGCDHAKESYNNIHTFLLPLVWSADGSKAAFVERIFDWEYYDPFGRYFDGEAKNVRYYLVIASKDHAAGYPIDAVAAQQIPAWQGNSHLMLGNMTYDLDSLPPAPIP
jgi:hypothetical protein